jgi:hypothetical protein
MIQLLLEIILIGPFVKIHFSARRIFGRNIPKDIQLTLHKIAANSALLFGSEISSFKSKDKKKLEAHLMRCLNLNALITTRDHMRSDTTREQLGVANVVEDIEKAMETPRGRDGD